MAAKKQKKTEPKANISSEATRQLDNQIKALESHIANTAHASEPSQAESEQPTTETSKRTSGGKRSVCAMYKVVVSKARGKKCKVTVNEWGVPNGKTRARLQSYIGMLARTTIPIDIASWPSVDPELKSKLWLDIQGTFKVKPHCEDLVLKSAGLKWRQFKTTLTNKFVLPFVGQKKKLSKPPPQYGFVSKSTWKKFVKQRSDPNWMKLHEVQSGRVRKRKYHHRLSRKGYIGLKEEEIKSGKLEPGEEPDRAVLWKKARQPKDGEEVDEDFVKICDKIDNLLEQKNKGELHLSGGEDVLTTALETPEHSGRVRAVGGYITPKQYFNLPRQKSARITKAELMARDRERDEEMERRTQSFMAEIAQLKAMMISGGSLHSPIHSDKSSFDPNKEIKLKPQSAKGLDMECNDDDDDCVPMDAPPRPPPPPISGQRSCELAVDNIENKVAFGMVYPREDDGSHLVHGIDMPPGCLRVSVDGLIKPDALLPVPVPGEMVKVREAVGSYVAWPEELISYPTTVIKRKGMSRPKKIELQDLKTMFSKVKLSAKVPKGFNLLYKHATTWMQTAGVSIQVQCESEVFGHEKTIYMLHENILALLEFEMIGQAVIASYMVHLHTEISDRPELAETFAFVDPGSTFHLNADFESYIVNRLKEGNPDRMFFLPHNHDMHWILAIIWEGQIYILNPLPHPTQFPALEKALSRAVKNFNSETGRGSKLPAKAKFLSGSPKQPGGHECGYVVMRYMKEIIADTKLTFATKWLPKTRTSYTEAQLDEVRIEALTYIQESI